MRVVVVTAASADRRISATPPFSATGSPSTTKIASSVRVAGALLPVEAPVSVLAAQPAPITTSAAARMRKRWVACICSILRLRRRFVTETGCQVVVHHAHALHIRVHDGRADELETALLQILAERVRFLGRRADVAVLLVRVLDDLPADETPDVAVERAELLAELQELPRVHDGRFDLLAVADDAGVVHQAFHVPGAELRDFV